VASRRKSGRQAEDEPLPPRHSAVVAMARAIFLHPVVALILGVLIAFAGRGEVLARSIGIALIALWLIIDLWWWMRESAIVQEALGRYYYIFGCTVTSGALILAMGAMYFFLNQQLKDEQVEVQEKLYGTVSVAVSGDPIYSIITIINDSRVDIGAHNIKCILNGALFSGGIFFGPNIEMFPFTSISNHLRANGDKWSGTCLNLISLPQKPLVCADLTIIAEYVLEDQPKLIKHKRFRYVTQRSVNRYAWYGEPVDEDADRFCQKPAPGSPAVTNN